MTGSEVVEFDGEGWAMGVCWAGEDGARVNPARGNDAWVE